MSVSSSAPDKPEEQGTDGNPSVPLGRYSRAQLAHHNGSDPNVPILIAYKGKVYDLTASYPWAKGSHWGDHLAGQDLTRCMKELIYGEEMLSRVPWVGVFDA